MIYLDNNATTQPAPEVVEAVQTYLKDRWGNPSSAHAFGLEARAGLESARGAIARLVGSDPETVVFTSSATEANNTAIISAIRANPAKRQIVTGATEHSAVISLSRAQEAHGYGLILVTPQSSGVVDVKKIAAQIDDQTALVSIMWANNETGVLNPVPEIAALCRARGVPFHCDAVQAAGKIPIDLRTVPIDYLSLSAHKIHGPKGVGALIVAPGARFTPLLYGGHQESGRRGGTENLPAIMGFAKAATAATTELMARTAHITALRDRLERGIIAKLPNTIVHGQGASRLPNTTNLGFPGVDSDTLVTLLDQRGVCVSSGSACLSDAVAPSHVILAMTGSYQQASEAVRFSLSHLNTSAEIDQTIGAVIESVQCLR